MLGNLYNFTISSCLFLQPEAISMFTSEPALVSFAEFFCKTSEGMKHVSFNTHQQMWAPCLHVLAAILLSRETVADQKSVISSDNLMHFIMILFFSLPSLKIVLFNL